VAVRKCPMKFGWLAQLARRVKNVENFIIDSYRNEGNSRFL
jgi:hypothetical protein